MIKDQPSKRVTSFDVAHHAGVSQSTVSRALSGSEVITEPTRKRVIDAAKDLGYFVDERAARLRRGHTGMLAVVVICRPGEAASTVNPFYYNLLGSICAAASERGYEALVSLQSEEGKFFGHYVERGQAEGMIVIGTTSNRAAWEFFRDLEGSERAGSHPAAYWGSPYDDLDWIRADNDSGGRLAARHLLDRGYRDIAFIGSNISPQRQFKERYEAYCAVMRDAGLEPSLIEIDEALERGEQGRRAVRDIMRGSIRPDAVMVACDAIALGVLEELRTLDIAVPGEIGVIGFDGLNTGAHASPPLSSIAPDFAMAGSLLVEAVLSGPDGDTNRRIPVKLIERASTGGPVPVG